MVVVPAQKLSGIAEHSLTNPFFCLRVNWSNICNSLIILIFSSVARFWFYFSGSVMLLWGSCFSASLATKLANKLKEKVLSKTASVWRSCEDLPFLCYLLSCATAAWLHDNRPKRELARGQEVAWPTCRCRIRKRVKCYNHRLFCFTVQNVLIKKRGNLLTPAPN